MVLNAKETAMKLTSYQKQCILSLSKDWVGTGYCKVTADLLHTLGDAQLYGMYAPLVDIEYRPSHRLDYRHRLTPMGVKVQTQLRLLH